MINTIIKRKLVVILSSIIVLGLMLTSLFFIQEKEEEFELVENDNGSYRKLVADGEEYKYNSSVVPILFLGIDSTDTAQNQGQADMINCLVLNRQNKSIKSLSLPRDLMTEIRLFDVAGRDLGWHKQHLSLAYANGKTVANGSMYTLQAISRLFNNVPLSRYITFDLSSIELVHNMIGGSLMVTVPNDSLVSVNKEWKKGNTVEITLDNVESYVRSRDINVDFSNATRMEMQKSYLIAYFEKLRVLLNEDYNSTITSMYETLQSIHTNMSYSDIETFSKMFSEYTFDLDNDFYILQGENKLGAYHDEVEINQQELQQILIKLFYKKEG